MQESFSQAAGRHLQDAKILCEQERWDNAVYLAGYVVECSFKVLIEIFWLFPQLCGKCIMVIPQWEVEYVDKLG